MNRRIINSVLAKKFKEWVESIKDETVKKAVQKDTIITGGAIVSLLLNEEVKDFDIYFKTRETARLVAEYYVKQFNDNEGRSEAIVLTKEKIDEFRMNHKSGVIASFFEFEDEDKEDQVAAEKIRALAEDRIKIVIRSRGVAVTTDSRKNILNQDVEDAYDALVDVEHVEEEENKAGDKYKPIFLSANAITLSNKIQLIVRFFGNAEQIHENYDFTHCTNYWESKDDEHYGSKLTLRPEALECIINKQLKYQGSKYPICSVIRTRKFLKRGYHIDAGQYLKMCFQISLLDLTNPLVLEDQLVGVDSAYFGQLIHALEMKKASDPSFEVSNGYLATLIDRIF